MNEDRTWDLPKRNHAMRMRWHDLMFMHGAFDADVVQALLPSKLPVDTFDGKAWIGVVPFRMSDVAPRGVPALPGLSAFPELNVRTYVTRNGKPGVWFFSLDATNRMAVRIARRFFYLPYMDARMQLRPSEDAQGSIDYSSKRTHRGEKDAQFVARYHPMGPTFRAQSNTLEHFLTARYCLYAQHRKGHILRGEIDHPPWDLQRAEAHVEQNSMLSPLGLSPITEPHLLFAKELSVRAWTNERVE